MSIMFASIFSGKIRTNLWRDWRAANVAGISDTGSHSVAKLSVKLSVQDAEFDIVCPIRSLLCIPLLTLGIVLRFPETQNHNLGYS